MDSVAVKNCIPLSLYTTISTVNHPGPMCMENNPSESKTIAVSHDDPINKRNNPSQSSKLSRNYIPDEIAFSILSKLPVKSLKRFACSCKSWSILFENINFMNMYSKQFMFRHGSDDDDYHTFILTNHLAENSGACHSAFHLLDKNNNSVKLNLPSPLQRRVGIICIMGSTSVNGIFCLAQNYYPDDVQYVLWNPAIEEFMIIPSSPTATTKVILSRNPTNDDYIKELIVIPSNHAPGGAVVIPPSPTSTDDNDDNEFMGIPSNPEDEEFMGDPSSPDDTDEIMGIPSSPDELIPNHYPMDRVFQGFGYDLLRDDFKVFQYVSFDFVCRTTKSYFEIYSLKSNSWRMIDMDRVLSLWVFPERFAGLEVYVGGGCHWLVTKLTEEYQEEIALLSFDLSDEVFLTTPIGVKPYSSDTSYNKHLAVLNGSIALISNYHDEIVFHISILGELGVSDSWIKLYTYGSFPSIQWPPIGFGKMGFIYVTKKNYELAYVDLSTQIVKEIGITGGKFEIFYVNAGLYKKSLLSIGGSSN